MDAPLPISHKIRQNIFKRLLFDLWAQKVRLKKSFCPNLRSIGISNNLISELPIIIRLVKRWISWYLELNLYFCTGAAEISFLNLFRTTCLNLIIHLIKLVNYNDFFSGRNGKKIRGDEGWLPGFLQSFALLSFKLYMFSLRQKYTYNNKNNIS